MLIAQERLAQPASEWAQRAHDGQPEATTGDVAERLRTRSARYARINGALAGTPFLLALVPAYVSVLWEQARMVMRVAALNGRDPAEPRFAAELLSLRGLYETPERALQALSELGTAVEAPRPGIRGRIEIWGRLVYRILIFAGFLSAPDRDSERKRPLVVRGLMVLFGAALYVLTWVIPLTFMMMMSWGCEQDTRTLGDRAIVYYGNEEIRRQRGLRPANLAAGEFRSRRWVLIHTLLLVSSLLIPLGLVAVAVTHPVQHSDLVAIAGVLGLAVVLAASARAART